MCDRIIDRYVKRTYIEVDNDSFSLPNSTKLLGYSFSNDPIQALTHMSILAYLSGSVNPEDIESIR